MTGFHFLLDENVEPTLGEKLRDAGHDVVHVLEVDELGAGTPDDAIRRYAASAGRIVVTYDHHFAAPDDHATVFYCPDQEMPVGDLFRVVDAITEQYESTDDLPSVVFASENWL